MERTVLVRPSRPVMRVPGPRAATGCRDPPASRAPVDMIESEVQFVRETRWEVACQSRGGAMAWVPGVPDIGHLGATRGTRRA